ncbi:MAG: ScyD/ScyE family protein [bacterium]|nr:ScyD/ScyE family protein [bacterium]
MLKKSGLFAALLIVILAAFGALAQDAAPVIVADGLTSPRHVTIDADGNVYVAEAGNGGDLTVLDAFGSEISAGFTSQVSSVSAEGEQSVLLGELFSRAYFGEGSYLGAHKIVATEDSYWVLLGEGAESNEIPEGTRYEALVQLNRETLEEVQVIDLGAYEVENNPDEDPQTIASNPVDFDVAADGTIFIVDASANSVLTWTEADGLALFAAYPLTDDAPSSVPSSVDVVDGEDGTQTVYIGFLGGFPFVREGGSARIEVYTDGELTSTITGVNLVTDVQFNDADGLLYVVELADGFGNEGYIPASGRIITVDAEGTIAPVVESLNFPYGLAMNADGQILVSVNSSFSEPGSGQVIVAEPGTSASAEPEEPAATEEGSGS